MRFLENNMGVVKSTPRPVTSGSVLYREAFEKEVKYKIAVYKFGSISKPFMEAQIKNHIDVLHEVALRYDQDYIGFNDNLCCDLCARDITYNNVVFASKELLELHHNLRPNLVTNRLYFDTIECHDYFLNAIKGVVKL